VLGAVAVPGAHANWYGSGDGGAPPGDAGLPRPFDDTALYLVVGGPLAPTCADPVPLPVYTPMYPPNQADVSIQVPQGDQQPGMLSLQTRATVTPTDALEICAGSPCNAGGSAYPPYTGTIQITAVDAAHVAFTVSGTKPYGAHVPSIDGTYSALRCP
jgi:hypothetical protein